MPKKTSYKNISERQTTIIQNLNYDIKELKLKNTELLKNQNNMIGLLNTIGVESNYEDLCSFIKFLYDNKEDLIDYINNKKNKIDNSILLNEIKDEKEINNLEIQNNINIASKNEEIKNIENNENYNDQYKIDEKVTIEDNLEYTSVENSSNNSNTNTINDNSINIENASKDENEEIETVSLKRDDVKINEDNDQNNDQYKVKISFSIVNRIKNFYNNYYENKLNVKYDGTSIDNVKININDNFDTINKTKSEIIYNYYNLYNKYMEVKMSDNNLSFNDYID